LLGSEGLNECLSQFFVVGGLLELVGENFLSELCHNFSILAAEAGHSMIFLGFSSKFEGFGIGQVTLKIDT